MTHIASDLQMRRERPQHPDTGAGRWTRQQNGRTPSSLVHSFPTSLSLHVSITIYVFHVFIMINLIVKNRLKKHLETRKTIDSTEKQKPSKKFLQLFFRIVQLAGKTHAYTHTDNTETRKQRKVPKHAYPSRQTKRYR